MISHTCLTPPTGVPVEVITHCAWLLEPPLGTCSELPAGQVDAPGAATDDGGAATAPVEIPAPARVNTPMAAMAIAPLRTPCCLRLREIRTSHPPRKRVEIRTRGSKPT